MDTHDGALHGWLFVKPHRQVRSVVLPLVSIALNFLSVAAAYGLITVIFRDGRLQGLLGYASSGAITPWVPLFLFTFLFGISMDYHV
jgi:RND superfamily putative drug exporter